MRRLFKLWRLKRKINRLVELVAQRRDNHIDGMLRVHPRDYKSASKYLLGRLHAAEAGLLETQHKYIRLKQRLDEKC
jgi:hypothetical protein